MRAINVKGLELCDSYKHSQIIPINSAKQMFTKIVGVYRSREDIEVCLDSSRMYQGLQTIGDETLLIVVSISGDWWSPWKGEVREDVYYYSKS